MVTQVDEERDMVCSRIGSIHHDDGEHCPSPGCSKVIGGG